MFPQIFNLLTTSPGNLVYHLVLAFSIVAALQAVILNRRTESQPRDSRLVLALGVTLACQLILFISSGLAWQGVADPQTFLPPVDRAIALLSLMWIAWVWIFPTSSRPADAAIGIISLGVIVALLVSLTGWAAQANTLLFNQSSYDTLWTVAGLVLLFAAIALLLIRRPNGWGVGLGFLLINLAGYLAHLLWGPVDQNFSGIIRLAQLCTYPLLPSLARQAVADQPQAAEAQPETQSQSARKRYSADPRTVQIWLDLAASAGQPQRIGSLVQALTRTMLADLGLMVADFDGSDDAVVVSGFDLIREETIAGRILPMTGIPRIAGALRQQRPIRLPVDDVATTDLNTITKALDLSEPGQVLVIPLEVPEAVWSGLLLLSPYSKRMWTIEDQNLLCSVTGKINQIIADQPHTEPEVHPEAVASEEPQVVEEEVKETPPAPPAEPVEVMGLAESELAAMLAVQKEAQATIARLENENKKLREMVEEFDELAVEKATSQLESELRLTLQEVAHLRNDLAEANKKILELSQRSPQPAYDEDHEVITSLAQELRQPLSTIIGYTDLLLGESIGILGALQQKFLEKIKSSSQRMRILLDDLLQMASLHDGQLELAIQPVDLLTTMDYVLTDLRADLREKKINLRIDFPEELPNVYADKDAISQITTHLLHNAIEVTPIEGDIVLRAQTQSDDSSTPHVLFQVTDSGSGVPEADLPRVFTRIYRAEHPLVPGVADSGVGLAIAKTLVEAQGGKIWVESTPGQGTTFSVLLPVEPSEIAEPNTEE